MFTKGPCWVPFFEPQLCVNRTARGQNRTLASSLPIEWSLEKVNGPKSLKSRTGRELPFSFPAKDPPVERKSAIDVPTTLDCHPCIRASNQSTEQNQTKSTCLLNDDIKSKSKHINSNQPNTEPSMHATKSNRAKPKTTDQTH